MSLLLNIDTALETAWVSLSNDGEVLQSASSTEQKDHAAWLHPAIRTLLQHTEITLHQLEAVAVSIGPGSYTGLRVGLSAAKGFCYALNIPLIAVGTLEILASAVKDEATDLVCPLIDARRMEVYAAVYDKTMTEKMAPHALLIDESSFSQWLDTHHILFCGSGSKKLQNLLSNKNAAFTSHGVATHAFARLSQKYFLEKKFADLAYTEPLYIKEFYTTARKD